MSVKWTVRAKVIVGWIEAPDKRTAYRLAMNRFETDECEVMEVQAVISEQIANEEKAIERSKRYRANEDEGAES